jgi:uncharacterized membrane protein
MPGDSATLTVSTTANTPANAFNITLTATAGQIVRTAIANLNVISSDFSISIDPINQIIVAGNSLSFMVKTKAINNFTQPIELTLSIDPKDSDITGDFTSSTINADSTTTLTINTSVNTKATTFTIRVIGTSSQIVHTAIAQITVMAAPVVPDFSINLNPSQLEVSRGQTGTINITITRSGGFSGSVRIISPDTKATKIKLTPSMQTTSGTMASISFKIKKKAALGIQQFIFTGVDDSGRMRLAAFAFNVR